MSFTLTTEFYDCFDFKGKVYNVDMSFDNILLLFEMFDDGDLYEHEKVYFALQMLIEEYNELDLESHEESFELFKYLLNEFLEIDLDKKSESGEVQVKKFDYQKDATLIYASFFAVYRMDLFELKGMLHWRKFEALLLHLDDNSPFKKVVGYRTMKIPSEKQIGKEHRNHLVKMQQLYSIDERKPEERMNSAFDALSHTFKNTSKKK
ncbi:Gp15 family bacteriophage protein [Metabacillus sp. FJAT-53654]|uniref:Gp15 family bacteriophage protein n=1 Tax=Metabacillus rhizosphaerae TaxID=3117747 RepID=A0ABZ2MYC9_9BACI